MRRQRAVSLGLTSSAAAAQRSASAGTSPNASAVSAPIDPPVQRATGCLHTFDAPVPEFSLTRVAVADDVRLRLQGPEILIVTEGIVEFVTQSGHEVAAEPGEPVWVPASDGCYLARGGGVFYRAAVGRI